MPSVSVVKTCKPGDKDYPKTLNVEGYDKPDEKLKTDRDGYRVLRRMLMLPRHVCLLKQKQSVQN